MKETTYSEGECLYQQGGFDSNIYYLLKGNLEIYDQLPNHQIKIR